MKTEIIQSLTNNFESYAKQTENGVEFWLARDLQHLLGYEKWDNFKSVISKAKTACEVSGHKVSDHFADVGKTIKMPKGAEKIVDDFMLTRYACYLIAQNGDSRKEEIAFDLGNGYEYSEKLCNKVAGKNVVVWNSDWLNPETNKIIDSHNLVNTDTLDQIGVVITNDEVELFEHYPF